MMLDLHGRTGKENNADHPVVVRFDFRDLTFFLQQSAVVCEFFVVGTETGVEENFRIFDTTD